MLVTETAQASKTGSLWFLITLAVVICVSIDAMLIVGLVERFDAWHVTGLAFVAAMLGAAILGTVTKFDGLSNRSEE